MRKTDWVVGIPRTLYRIDLPHNLHLELHASQHQSGKVTIDQNVSLTWGFLDMTNFQIKKPRKVASLSFYDKINTFIRFEREIRDDC